MHGCVVEMSPTEGGPIVSVNADSFDKLLEKLEDAKRSIRAAASESEAEVRT